MSEMTDSRPWLGSYGDVPETLEYPAIGLYEALAASAARHRDATAVDFLGSTLTYGELIEAVDRCASALAGVGLAAGERITISMPTSPQGVIAFYAAAKLGAVASLIHPLSTAAEIEGYLNMSRSRLALTLDAFYGAFAEVRDRTPLETLILARIRRVVGVRGTPMTRCQCQVVFWYASTFLPSQVTAASLDASVVCCFPAAACDAPTMHAQHASRPAQAMVNRRKKPPPVGSVA